MTKLRFGPGIVNKLGTGFAALMFLFGVAIVRVRLDLLIILLVAGAVGCAFYFMRRVLVFAETHPGPALLEGEHLIRYRRQELDAKHRRLRVDAPGDDPERRFGVADDRDLESEDG